MKVFIFFCHTTRWICSSKASARLNSYKNKRNVILTNIPAKVCTNAVESEREFCSICSTHIWKKMLQSLLNLKASMKRKFPRKEIQTERLTRIPICQISRIYISSRRYSAEKWDFFKHATFQENPTCSPSRLQPLEIKDSERHYLPKELEKRPLKVTGMTSIITQLSRWKASLFWKTGLRERGKLLLSNFPDGKHPFAYR